MSSLPSFSRSTLCFAFTLAVLPILTLPASAQGWRWPETSQNLQVLSPDTDAETLSATMRFFVRSLGVRCTHCHVGTEGQPLSTFDFASDDRPAKEQARIMMRMVQSINADHLPAAAALYTDNAAPLRVTCRTCHRGVARPEPLASVLKTTLANDGVQALRATYDELRTAYYGSDAYDFSERSLDAFGQELLAAKQQTEALAVFILNTEQYPMSASAFARLASAYETTGDRVRAEAFYLQAITLAPTSTRLVQRLEALRAEQ